MNTYNFPKNLAAIYSRLAKMTQNLIIDGNMQRVNKYLNTIDHVFAHGSEEVRHVIANTYIFSVTTFMEFNGCNVRLWLPPNLLQEYYKQVNTGL